MTTNDKHYLINNEEIIKKEQASKTNKYKTRIIESEINSNLLFAILVNYNMYYSIICFSFQIISISFKLWTFNINSFSIIRIILVIFWGIVEIYRLNLGFKANIEEYFPSLINFDLITLVFSLTPQILLIIGPHVLPIDKSVAIIYLLFISAELIVSIFTMRKIVKRKTALYLLRNTTTTHARPSFIKNKSSKEIADEVEEMLKIEQRHERLYNDGTKHSIN